MTRDDACAHLGLEPGADAAAVRAAYARAVKEDHPDHGGAGTLLATLKQARDTLLTQGDIPSCVLCKGSGKVKLRFGAQACVACGGSGDQS